MNSCNHSMKWIYTFRFISEFIYEMNPYSRKWSRWIHVITPFYDELICKKNSFLTKPNVLFYSLISDSMNSSVACIDLLGNNYKCILWLVHEPTSFCCYFYQCGVNMYFSNYIMTYFYPLYPLNLLSITVQFYIFEWWITQFIVLSILWS